GRLVTGERGRGQGNGEQESRVPGQWGRFHFFPTSCPITPPITAPPTVPMPLPPVRTAPPTAPAPAPIAVALSWWDMPAHAPRPGSRDAKATLSATRWMVFM